MHLTERGLERQFGARTIGSRLHARAGTPRGISGVAGRRLADSANYVSTFSFADKPPRAMSAHSLELPSLSISETADEVVVHHADRLHMRIDDGRTDEAESAALEILAEGVGFA